MPGFFGLVLCPVNTWAYASRMSRICFLPEPRLVFTRVATGDSPWLIRVAYVGSWLQYLEGENPRSENVPKSSSAEYATAWQEIGSGTSAPTACTPSHSSGTLGTSAPATLALQSQALTLTKLLCISKPQFPHLSNEANTPWLEILLKENEAADPKRNQCLPLSWCGINASSFMHSAGGALITCYFPGTVMHTGDGFSKF